MKLAELEEEYLDYLMPTAYVAHVLELDALILADTQEVDGSLSGFVQAASDLIHQRFQYVKGATQMNSSI